MDLDSCRRRAAAAARSVVLAVSWVGGAYLVGFGYLLLRVSRNLLGTFNPAALLPPEERARLAELPTWHENLETTSRNLVVAARALDNGGDGSPARELGATGLKHLGDGIRDGLRDGLQHHGDGLGGGIRDGLKHIGDGLFLSVCVYSLAMCYRKSGGRQRRGTRLGKRSV